MATLISVLILVLMEDALVLLAKGAFGSSNSCLNPCFNGRCTSTLISIVQDKETYVLILVLMEDALVQNSNNTIVTCTFSLNPCFNGRCTSTLATGFVTGQAK